MKRLILAAAMALFVSISPAQAHDQCKITQFFAKGESPSYDPFANDFTPVPIAVTVRGNSDCWNKRIALAVGPTTTTPGTGTSSFSLGSGGDALQAQILGPGRGPMTITSQSAAFISPQIAGQLGRSGDLQGGVSLKLTVQPGQAVPPGDYHAELSLFLCVLDAGGSCDSGSIQKTSLPISVHVRRSLLLAASSAPYISVGELQPNVTSAPVYFDAYANVKYELLLVSDHDFTLESGDNRHGGADDGVPYVPMISGTAVTASSSVHGSKGRKIDFPVPGNGGRQRHSFAVKILPFSDKPAGRYSDVLTLCIRAQT
jgi:hypothetical protein